MTTQILGVTFRYSHTIGGRTPGGTGFRSPVAIARSGEERLYVVSRAEDVRPDGRRVTICTIGEDYIGEFAAGNPDRTVEASSADGSLIWPTSLALDKDSNVYVADEWLNRISIFSMDGEWIGKWGTPGDEGGELNGPSGIAFGADDNLYVVDSKNNRIQKFSKGGKFLAKWGREGIGDGEFNLPWGIDIDRNGAVYVADFGNDRIQKFAPNGQFLAKFGTSGTGDGEFNRPSGVAVDKEGVIYVADWRNNRVQVLDANGRFITKLLGDATISKWGQKILDASPDTWKQREVAHDLGREKLFFGPIAVEVDDQGRIFVADSSRHRIQIYRTIAPYFLGLYDNARL